MLLALLPAANGLAPALQKLLRFVQPALLDSVLISRRSLHCVDTGLHRSGGFQAVTKPRVRPADQVQSLGIIRTVTEKSLQQITRVAKLSGSDISRTNLAPDLLLRVGLIALHDLL